MIDIRGLVFEYADKRVLHGIDLSIVPNSITALLGPNGAGKTTLMRCVAALETPFAGEINVAGIDVLEAPREAHTRMGFLPDTFGLYDDLTVERCLLYAAAARRVPAADRPGRVAWAAEKLDLEKLLKRKAGQLSRGQRQRVAIGQTIIHRPKVLLLDEPAAGLDPDARDALSSLLRLLRDDGITIIVSSHILAELQDYSTHVLIVRDGRIVEYAPIGETAQREAQTRRLRLSFLPGGSGFAGLLTAIEGISDIRLAEDSAVFAFNGDRVAQAALVRRLVEQNIPLVSIAEEQVSMQDVYRASLRRQEP